MAKKKNRNKDFDSWLESIDPNTYIPQMAQNAPNNANLYGFGSWMGNMFSKPFDAISRRRSAKEFEAYENEHPIEGVSNGTGALNMQPSGQTWGNVNEPSIPMTQTEYDANPVGSNEFNNDLSLKNPYFSSGNRQSRKAARDLRIEALNERTDAGEGFLGKMNSNSGFNMGAIPGLAAETARVWSDPNSTKLDKVSNLFGIANISQLYSADTEKGDANINEMTGRLNDFKQNNIQDAWDTLGAGRALKLNKGPKQIQLMSNNLGWKDFKTKNVLGKTIGAIGQGAASGGSVGGAWGAAGGAVTGLFAGIGSLFGRKRRAKNAYNEYMNKLNYLNNNARMLNAAAQNEWRASNINAINNGVGQEKINDMANFRAYGGNLFDDGGDLGDDYVYEGRMLPEAVVEAESMPWYEKFWRKGSRFVNNNIISPTLGRAQYAWNYLNSKLADDDDSSYFLDLSNKDVKRVQENNQYNVDAILANDFVETDNPNSLRRKVDFTNTSDTLIGDRNIPLRHLSTYYGVEDGKLKAGALDSFKDNTLIAPNRASNIGKIKEWHPSSLIDETYKHNPIARWGAEKLGDLLSSSFVGDYVTNKVMESLSDDDINFLKELLLENEGIENPTQEDLKTAAFLYTDLIDSNPLHQKISDYRTRLYDYTNEKNPAKVIRGFAINENNDTIPDYEFNNYPKGIFADENGNAVFFSGLTEENDRLINEYLKKHPSYPVMLDNGRFSHYTTNNDLNVYSGGMIDPNKTMVIGINNNTKAMGGQFDFNLSPNMIDLQNQSLANQKYKYDNQMQPVGFVDGGAGKIPNPGFPRLACGGKLRLNKFDFGGSMNGMDIPTGMQSYENGGTHEENPNGGIQVGVDSQGTPNLVEEGEFRWGDYIFSDRIEVDPDILTNYTGESSSNGKKRGKKGKHQPTYANKAKKYAEKNKELANDPIGKNTINDYMDKLSKAEEEQKARDAAQQEYNNALTSPTQGNPMYGSMKYNGMGNANTGLNEGNAAMDGMDNSGLSNVNRSGNEMLHAFGGNLYPYGGYTDEYGNTNPLVDANGNIITVNQETGEMFANGKPTGQTLDPSTLDVNQPGYNYTAPTSKDFGLSLSGSNPTSGYLYTGDNLPYDIHYGTKVDAITGNPYLNNGTINPRWQEQGNKMLGNKLMPNGAHRDMYRFLDNSEFTPGMNNNFNGHGESNYVPRHLEANYQGPFGSTFRETNPFNPDKPQTPPVNNPPVQDTPPAANVPPAKEGPNTNTGGGNNNTGNGGTPNPPDTRNGGGNNSGMRTNIDVTGNPGNLNAQYAAGNPWQSTPYQEWTRFGAMAKGLPWVNSDAMGHTNWKYKIDNVPPDRMEALGRTGLALRNADHSGMFRAPDLMDVERQNNASQSLLANALRGISNVGGGNRGFVGAQSAAQNYNAQMGIGNNYATTNAYNADQKLKADEFNKQTEQFNANANNQMEADNQRAKQFAKTYEMQGLQNANAERLHERNYKDTVDRAAAADRANNVTNMWDNALEFMQGEAERNHQFNMANSNPINQYYWDKNKRQYIFKNDPNNPMLRMNNILRRENMGALSANSQKLLNSYIQQYGNNVPQELLDGLVEIEKQEQQRLADEKKATTNASYRDLENEYDMLLADYARRMNTKAEDGTTPKFANYTKDDYGVFEDLRTNRPVDEKGNPISDDDYYSRLRMRANMMRNMMYGANSYYNVTAYGGNIRTKKKKQHYYMDV